jgi:hypothetical protein
MRMTIPKHRLGLRALAILTTAIVTALSFGVPPVQAASGTIAIGNVSGVITTEAGGTVTFDVTLSTQPEAGETIQVGVSSSDPSEGTVSPTPLSFTDATWGAAQTVTVTGINDDVDDADVAYLITATMSSASAGSTYADSTLNLTNSDDDTAGVTVSAISGDTTEAGGTATFTVVLDSEPTATVTIGLSSSDTGEGTVSPASLSFTTANWDTAQTVTVTGVDDGVTDGDASYSVVTAAATGGDYAAIDPADVTVTNTDNDTAPTPEPQLAEPFDDLDGLSPEAADAINRLAGLGITAGTSETTFSPAQVVSRWQMALFLVREFEAVGVTLPTITGSTFTDIVTYDQDTQDAMNVLAALNVTAGTAAGEFSPEGTVTRRQMALFLTRFLDAAGLTLPAATGSTPFSDLDGEPIEVRIAVEVLVDLGITEGTAIDTFSPDEELPRWQMAIFLIRVIDAIQTP